MEIAIPHDDAYGGYLVEITRPDRAEAQSITCVDADGDPVDLEHKRLVINIPAMDWEVSMSAGFSLSGLVNEACNTGESNRCSDARPGLVSFFHVHHARMGWLAPMFGTGLSDGRTEYYIGGGLRLGSEATFNGGIVVGPVANGFGEDAPTRFRRTWFFGVSYRLIGGGGNEDRPPFAGSGQ